MIGIDSKVLFVCSILFCWAIAEDYEASFVGRADKICKFSSKNWPELEAKLNEDESNIWTQINDDNAITYFMLTGTEYDYLSEDGLIELYKKLDALYEKKEQQFLLVILIKSPDSNDTYSNLQAIVNGLSDLHEIVAIADKSSGNKHNLRREAVLDVYMEYVLIKNKELRYVEGQVVEYVRIAIIAEDKSPEMRWYYTKNPVEHHEIISADLQRKMTATVHHVMPLYIVIMDPETYRKDILLGDRRKLNKFKQRIAENDPEKQALVIVATFHGSDRHRHKLPQIILDGAAGFEKSSVTYLDSKCETVVKAYEETIGKV